jgi:hypothetical protein
LENHGLFFSPAGPFKAGDAVQDAGGFEWAVKIHNKTGRLYLLTPPPY